MISEKFHFIVLTTITHFPLIHCRICYFSCSPTTIKFRSLPRAVLVRAIRILYTREHRSQIEHVELDSVNTGVHKELKTRSVSSMAGRNTGAPDTPFKRTMKRLIRVNMYESSSLRNPLATRFGVIEFA